MDRIGHHRPAVAGNACRQFRYRQQQVHPEAHPRDSIRRCRARIHWYHAGVCVPRELSDAWGLRPRSRV